MSHEKENRFEAQIPGLSRAMEKRTVETTPASGLQTVLVHLAASYLHGRLPLGQLDDDSPPSGAGALAVFSALALGVETGIGDSSGPLVQSRRPQARSPSLHGRHLQSTFCMAVLKWFQPPLF